MVCKIENQFFKHSYINRKYTLDKHKLVIEKQILF